MSFKIACLLLLACVAAIHAAEAAKEADQGRIFLSTFTVILSTVTSTTTIASTTTCTTSTSALNTWFEIIYYIFDIDNQLIFSDYYILQWIQTALLVAVVVVSSTMTLRTPAELAVVSSTTTMKPKFLPQLRGIIKGFDIFIDVLCK